MKKLLTVFISVFVLVLLVYGLYQQVKKQQIPGKLDRLECHKKVTCFEKVFLEDQLELAKKLFMDGDLKIYSSIDKATHMPSTLFDFVSIEDTEQFLYNHIQTLTKNELVYKNGVIVKIKIYENDKEDPNKKSDKCKLFRGYVVFEILKQNRLIYKNQIDFMDYQGKDIPNTLECAIKSFLTS